MTLGNLESVFRDIYKAIPEEDCFKKLTTLTQQGWWGYFYSLLTLSPSKKQPLQIYLQKIEDLFQEKVREIVPILKTYEEYLKMKCEANRIKYSDSYDFAQKIDSFYKAVHPFLVIVKKYENEKFSGIKKDNLEKLLGLIYDAHKCPRPFYMKDQHLLGRLRAIDALESLYLSSLPYSFLKKVSRNYEELWIKKEEGTIYLNRLKGILTKIKDSPREVNWVGVFTRGCRALVEHINECHHIEGTFKASLPGLQLAFYMAGHEQTPRDHYWLGAFDIRHVEWRNSLREGMVLKLNEQDIILGNRLKKKQIVYEEKKVDKNLVFECTNFPEKLILIPQNRAIISLIPLFRNTAIPLYTIYEIDSKGRFGLVERLYPLEYALELYPLNEATKKGHPIIKAFEDAINENTQPSNFNSKYLMVNKKGEFRSLCKGQVISLHRETLEKVVLSLVNKNPELYRLFVKGSTTMKALHELCIECALITDYRDLQEIAARYRISFVEDCKIFCDLIKDCKKRVCVEFVKRHGHELLEKNEKMVLKLIQDAYRNLDACGQFTEEFLYIICDRMMETIQLELIKNKK